MRYFLDVAETEHMTRSAHRLHVVQPTLSRSIARLKQELGVLLFSREGRGLRLTEEGKLFQRRLRPLLLELSEACSEASLAGNTPPSQVRVHLGAASHIAADAIAEWLVQQPSHGVVLTQSVQAWEDKVDVVVDSHPPEISAEHRCFSERVMIACPAGSGFSVFPFLWTSCKTATSYRFPIHPGSASSLMSFVRQRGLSLMSPLKATTPVLCVR